jgi:LysR family transcriptional regulator, cyn operon transcriptional activator
MELRHLRYFLAIAGTGSFTRAAAELHLTQPTLSHQIRQLEEQVGAMLFDRVGRSVRLTAAGRVFKEHAERALRELSSATAALEELQGLVRGVLRIGVFQSFNSSLLPPILAEFAGRHPGVQVQVRQLPTREMEELLLQGELDLGIAYVQPDSARILAEKLFDERMMLVVSEAHPYARRRELQLKQLADQPLVLLTPEFPSRQLLLAWFAAAGFEPKVNMEINSTDAILATVRCGTLATIQTARMAAGFAGLRCIPLSPALRRTVAILWRREGYRPAAARALADMIKNAYSGAAATRFSGSGSALPVLR